MASPLDILLDSVKSSIVNHVQQGGHTGFDTGGLIGKITDLFSQHKSMHGDGRNVAPASQDPYGDPGDQGGGYRGNVRPASQDPYGDPADDMRRH